MSPDTVSSLFPDRPIRPLPKRRIRERLSPEVADAIKYPPSTHENAPLFYYPPYTLKEGGSPRSGGSMSPVESGRRNDVGRTYTPRRNGAGIAEGEGDEPALRSTLVTRSPPEILTRATRRSTRLDPARNANPQPPPSTTSSIDGYDSFENTNNKKKRKIPSAGDTTLNGTHGLNNDIGSLAMSAGIHSPANDLNGDRHSYSAAYPGSGSFMANSQGISGPGRGRLGRSRNARSPLRALSDGTNTWAGRTLKTAAPQWAASSEQEGSGIISSAIANAEKLRPQGQENISLLQQHSSTSKAAPSSTQFTFSCDSQVPGTVQWPGHSSKHNMSTQTGSSGGASGSSVPAGGLANGQPKPGNGPSVKERRQARRDLEKELRVAARQRRRLAAETYFANPPKAEDIWICELCEYERIFGEPPRALIRRYEAKDRKQRQEELDRKRLLEKAKAKSRKARKNGKLPTKVGQAQSQVESQGDQGGPSNDGGTSHSTQSEAEENEGERVGEHASPPSDPTSSIDDSGGNGVVQRPLTRNYHPLDLR